MERTLIIFKPDCVQRRLVGTILQRFEARGLKLAALKLLQVDRSLAERHYAEHQDKPFFPSLLSFITGGPVVVGVLVGPNAVAVVRNEHDVELNLVYNANADAGGKNILMDVGEKYPGYTHVALRVASIKQTIVALRENGVRITQGPVAFGRDGHVSVFVRDPDLNVVELRGRDEDLSSIGGVTAYIPEN